MFREVLHDLFSLNKSLTVHDFALFAEEDLAYAQTVLPTSPPPPTTPSSSIQTTIPLVIKSESKVPPYKAEDLDSILSYPDQKQRTSLYCVAKQLYASELAVLTTIYCSYSSSKTLPPDSTSEMERGDASPGPGPSKQRKSETECDMTART